MSDNITSLTLVSLTNILNKNIMFFTTAILFNNKNTNKDMEYKNIYINLLITDSSLIVLSKCLNNVLFEISFDIIQKIRVSHLYPYNVVLIDVNKILFEEKCFCIYFNGTLNSFFDNIKLQYISYCLNNLLPLNNIKIIYTDKNYNINKDYIINKDELELVSSKVNIYNNDFFMNFNSNSYNKRNIINFNSSIIEKISENIPVDYEIIEFFDNAYLIALPLSKIQEDNNSILYLNNKSNNKTIQIGYHAGEISPIEKFIFNNPDYKIFSFYSYYKLVYLLKEKHKIKNYVILNSSPFIKRNNFSSNDSVWEGWKIEVRTAVDKEISNNTYNKGINLVYYFLRRKYIPPFFDTYQHISFYVAEYYDNCENTSSNLKSKDNNNVETSNNNNNYLNTNYSMYAFNTSVKNLNYYLEENNEIEHNNYLYIEEDISISREAIETIEIIINSITPINEDKNSYKTIMPIINNIKIDSFLLDDMTINYFVYGKSIFGKHAYKLAINFTTKLILILEDYIKEKLKEINKFFIVDKVANFYKNTLDHKEFSFEEFQLSLKDKNFFDLIINFKKDLYNNYKNELKNVNNNIKNSIDSKYNYSNNDNFILNCPEVEMNINIRRNNYLFWYINGGATDNILKMEDIIFLFMKFSELEKYNYIFELLLIPNLIAEDKGLSYFNLFGSSILYNDNQLKTKNNNYYNFKTLHSILDNKNSSSNLLYLNLDLLVMLIRSGYLKQLYKLSNQFYAVLLNKIILKYPYTNVLNAVYFYLSKNKPDVSDNIRSWYGETIPSLIIIYKENLSGEYKICPLLTIQACECLIILTEKDKQNKTILLNSYGILNILTDSISNYFDEKLLFFSLKLLYNIVSLTQENISLFNEEIYNNINSTSSENDNYKESNYDKNKKIILISKLCKIIKGIDIPQIYNSTRIILITIDILILLSTGDNNEIKLYVSDDNELIKCLLLNFYVNNSYSQPVDFENPFDIEIKTLELLNLLLKKNSLLRNLLKNNFNFHFLLESRLSKLKPDMLKFDSSNTANVLVSIKKHQENNNDKKQDSNENKYNSNIESGFSNFNSENIPIKYKFLKLFFSVLEYYISKDRDLINNIKDNCKTINNLIINVIENHSNLFLKESSSICSRIYYLFYVKN